MSKTATNVLVGTATLYVRKDDAKAEWDSGYKQAGSYSARLYKAGTGNDGSTHWQMTPPTGITLAAWTTGIAAGHYSFYHWLQALTANWVQMEFRFEDPNSDGWLELTWMHLQSTLGTGAWVQSVLADADLGGYGGVGEAGVSFFNYGPLTAMSGMEAAINGEGAVTNASDWILTRVRLELWEASPERTCRVDTVVINNVAYTIEPGGTAPAQELSSPDTEVGYTEDGVVVTYTEEGNDIEVNEETFAIDHAITREMWEVTCNMAESSLFNLDKAMSGASLSGNILTLGGGVAKKHNLRIVGLDPAGYSRTYHFPKVVAVGAVGMTYRKAEKAIVPVTFRALKDTDLGYAVALVDNAA